MNNSSKLLINILKNCHHYIIHFFTNKNNSTLSKCVIIVNNKTGQIKTRPTGSTGYCTSVYFKYNNKLSEKISSFKTVNCNIN